MRQYTFAFLYILLILVYSQLPFSSITPTNCYSKCSTCFSQPLNCTSCPQNLLLIKNDCLINSKQAILDQQFYPISNSINSSLYYPSLSNLTQRIISCTYKQDSNQIQSAFFFANLTSLPIFQLSYGSNIISSHDFLNILFTMIQINWGEKDIVVFKVNNQILNITKSKINSPFIVNCNNQNTSTTRIQIPLNDTNKQLLISFTPNLSSTAQYGITGYFVRYGNCDATCQKCFGANANNCLTCKSYLKLNQLDNTCFGCDLSFYQSQSGCRKCDPTCINCNGPGTTNCTQCDTSLFTLQNNTCVFQNPYNLYLYELNQTFFSTQTNWSLSTGSTALKQISICGLYSYLGGYQTGTANTLFSKIYYDLSIHFGVSILMHIILIDSVGTSITINYNIDVISSSVSSQTSSKTNQCGGSLPQSLNLITINNVTHSNSNLTFSFKAAMSMSNFIGVRNVLLILSKCPPSCLQCDPTNPDTCMICFKNLIKQPDYTCKQCPTGFYFGIRKQRCHLCSIWCQNCSGPSSSQCLSCNPPLILSYGVCIQSSDYGIYGFQLNKNIKQVNKIQSWAIYPNLQNFGNDVCGDDYILGSSQILYKRLSLSKTFTNLPKHTQITLYFNFYKIDDYTDNSVTFNFNGVNVSYSVQNHSDLICGNTSEDSIKKIYYSVNHTGSDFKFSILVNQMAKVGINNLIIFLKNCEICKSQLNAKLYYMPVYSIFDSQKSLNVWIDFNNDVYNHSKIQSNINGILQIPGRRNLVNNISLVLKLTKITSKSYLFNIPMNTSFQNQKLHLIFIEPSLINFIQYNQVKPLINGVASTNIIRYDNFNDVFLKRTLKNLFNFNQGFAAAVLYLSIVLFFFGLSFVLQQFVTIIQIIFIHIFICPQILPLSLKIPLQGMQQIQYLNYFTMSKRVDIQMSLLPANFYQPGSHLFQKYYPDTNFIRAFYPILFLNIFYILIFVGFRLSIQYIDTLKIYKKNNFYLKYLEDTYLRPVNYFDSFMRLEFMTIIWASFLQFLNIKTNIQWFTIVNGIICVLFFAFFAAYPILIMIYLIYQQKYMQDTSFSQLYKDILANKYRGQIFSQNPTPFISILVRFYKILIICGVVIFQNIYQNQLTAPISICLLNILQTLYIIYFKVYTNQIILCFKLIQNGLLFVLQLLYIAIYAVGATFQQNAHLRLGFACQGFIILMLVNAACRAIYLLYKKIMEFIQQKNQFLLKILKTNPLNQAQNQMLKNKTFMNGDSVPISQLQQHSRLGSGSNLRKNNLPHVSINLLQQSKV